MTVLAWVFLGGGVLAALGYVNLSTMEISPDGRRYLAAGAGRAVPYPFALRWLLPWICEASVRRWQVCAIVHLLALPPLTTLWLSFWIHDDVLLTVGGLLMCGLAGIWRIQLHRPVLVDSPAVAWSLGAAVLVQHEMWVAALLAVVVAGSIKETAPVFAACYAWHPLLLLGLLAPLVRRLISTPGPDPMGEESLLRHPLRAGTLSHMDRWFDARSMIAPWGAGVLAVLATDQRIIPMVVITTVLAYAQLLFATGTVRLYQWAAPPVVLAAVGVIPAGWAVAVLLAHLLNPWPGPGR
jgi:hypothetical protein